MTKRFHNPLLGITLTEKELAEFRWQLLVGVVLFFIGFAIIAFPIYMKELGFEHVALATYLFIWFVGFVVLGFAVARIYRAVKTAKKPTVPFNAHRSIEQKKKLERRAARNKGN